VERILVLELAFDDADGMADFVLGWVEDVIGCE
jgi:hypothetical protein